MNQTPAITADIIKQLAKQQGFIPGIYLVVHTFGRDLKRNFHLHLSTTIGGISSSHDSWIKGKYIYHDTLKKMWRYAFLTFLRKEFKEKRIKLPRHLKHIRSYEAFCSWTSQFYNQTWVVHLSKQSNNHKFTVEYLGRYLKRPPIGETRIKKYDGKLVTFEYLDHYTKTKQIMTLPVLEFIARLISHIPDKYFRNIRYYGFLANRVRGKLLPTVYLLLKNRKQNIQKVYTPWRDMLKKSFHYDPLTCPRCQTIMKLNYVVLPIAHSIINKHWDIAHGYYQLL
jgi:hypothetical protein